MNLNEGCCPIARMGSVESLTTMLLAREYRPLLEEYRDRLADDPAYLRFHGTRAILRLQFELKLHDLPALDIVWCRLPLSSSCCLLDALTAAITMLPKHSQSEKPGSLPIGTGQRTHIDTRAINHS